VSDAEHPTSCRSTDRGLAGDVNVAAAAAAVAIGNRITCRSAVASPYVLSTLLC